MIDNIKNNGIDVEKVKQLFDEILTYILDYRHEQDYARQRVELADEIFKLTQEVIEVMYRINLQFLSECDRFEAMNKIKLYSEVEDNLSLIQKDTDILQA